MKTSELTGAALDWAVAKCEGIVLHHAIQHHGYLEILFNETNGGDVFTPSNDWAQGGPIIEREEMTISHSPYDHVFYGRTRPWCAEKKGRMKYGPTPLIAAMRCYCCAKLGDEIDIPEELCQQQKS